MFMLDMRKTQLKMYVKQLSLNWLQNNGIWLSHCILGNILLVTVADYVNILMVSDSLLFYLLCVMPGDIIHQGRTSGWERVKQIRMSQEQS